MQKKKKKSQTNKQNESMKLKKLACTLPNQLYFQYFILLLFSSTTGSLSFHIFFFFCSSIFSSTHVQSHSSISTPLSFKFPLIFVILCCLPLCSTFFLCVRLLQPNGSKFQCIIASDFSPLLTQVSHRGFFVLLYFFFKVRLFISFFFFLG